MRAALPSPSPTPTPSPSPAPIGSVLSHQRLSNGENGLPANFTSDGDQLGIVAVSIGDWDGNGYGDFVVATRDYSIHIILMGLGNNVDEVVTLTPTSEGFGLETPSVSGHWGHSLAFVGEEPLPGSPSETGVRVLLGHFGVHSVYDFLVTRNGTFAESRLYTQQSPGILGYVPAGGRFGITVESADVNGDGHPDMIVTRDEGGESNRGAVHILFRNSTMDVYDVDEITGGVGVVPSGATAISQGFGYSLAWIGAWGDGTNVLAIGSGPPSGSNGAVYLIGFNQNGTQQWYQKLESGEHGLPPIAAPPTFGAGLGAMDLDGVPPLDLAVAQRGTAAQESKLWFLVLDSAGRNVSSYLQVGNNEGGPGTGNLITTGQFGSSIA